MRRKHLILRQRPIQRAPQRTARECGASVARYVVDGEACADAVTDFPSCDAGADGDDFAGTVGAGDEVVARVAGVGVVGDEDVAVL